ncbi:hypothetical protein [Desulfosporosinus sp. OT]|uniref:hypothetical protein n=1 Tax=Desulfosporosinus sp. OT TaxID=913865 RepID=UPI00058EE07C|nr:hypothetical protein [Desulfosporosinus sp. OT]
MKKIDYNCLALAVGCINWITAIIILWVYFFRPISISDPVVDIMNDYLIFSFIPTLISLILTIKLTAPYRLANLIINLLFISMYALIYVFINYVIWSILPIP